MRHRLSRRHFVGIVGLATGSVIISKQLRNRVPAERASIVDQLRRGGSVLRNDLLELGRVVISISPESVDRLEETRSNDPDATLEDLLAAQARSQPKMAPVSIDGWLLSDPVAGAAGAYARSVDQE